MMDKAHKNLLADVCVIVASIFFAIWLSTSGLVEGALGLVSGSVVFGGLIAGFFFTSIFTTAPAIVMLSFLAQAHTPWEVAIWGGLGAVMGDLLMFGFFKDRLARDFYALFHINMNSPRVFRIPRFRWLLLLLAGLVIASPFPDELGLTVLGFSNARTSTVAFMSFVFNSLGILALAVIAA
jgi:hypothetical protein